MNELRALLLLELRSYYGINQLLHTKDPKVKKRGRTVLIVWAILIAMAFSYVGGLVFGLYSLGLGEIVPTYLVVISSLMLVMLGIFSAGNRIFGQKGYDILAAMPVKSGTIVLSRFLGLYLAYLPLVLVVMLPGVVTYGKLAAPGVPFYIFALVGTLFIPAIPLVINTVIGMVITAISARMKHKSIIQSVLMVLLVVGVMAASFGAEKVFADFTQEQISLMAQNMSNSFAKVYPPAIWLSRAMVQVDVLQLLLFVLLSAGVMALAFFAVSSNFHTIVRQLLSVSAGHSYRIGKMASRSQLKALYVREAKRYFSSSIYVSNTIIGPIMGTILAIALAVTGLETVKSQLGMDVGTVLPFVFSAVFCMMTTTSVSVSMEGQQFWAVKSMPIPAKTLLDSKILLNLSLMLPFYLVSVAVMAIATQAAPLQLVWLVLIPAAMIVFCVVLGITVNLKFHSFDWTQEAAVVKQSLPAALGGFAGLALGAVCTLCVLAVPAQYGDAVKGIILLVLLTVTALMYRRNNRADLSELE